jgi:hypothetical protein
MHSHPGTTVGTSRRKKGSSYEATLVLTSVVEQLLKRVEELNDDGKRSKVTATASSDTALSQVLECISAAAERGVRQAAAGSDYLDAGCSPASSRSLELLAEHMVDLQRWRDDEASVRKKLLEELSMQNQVFGEMLSALRLMRSPVSPSSSLDGSESIPWRGNPRYRPSVGSDHQIYQYPEVQLRLKIYQVGNVDTSRMTFEIDFLCRLDWCDPNIDGIDSDELKTLDWDKYFNPRIDIENCKDVCTWVPGADNIPRRRTVHSGASSGVLDDTGQWLHKTMRFRGTLSLSVVNLRCFPFDIQVLPIRLKAARCPILPAGTPAANIDRAKERIGRVHLVDDADMNMPQETSYWATKPHLRARGHCALAAADETLLEFNISGLTGCHPNPKRGDVYEVHILVERPKFASYVWEMVIMNVLVLLSASAFWDTAAPELSSRMSISLTIILTLAAYTSARPAPIEKAPYVTFHDWWEQVCMLLVTGISVQNVFAVVLCGGHHEDAPAYMTEMFERNQEMCSVGWCFSRKIDCSALVYLLIAWLALLLYSLLWLARTRRATHGLWSKLLAIPCATAQAVDADSSDAENEGAALNMTEATSPSRGYGIVPKRARNWFLNRQKARSEAESSSEVHVASPRPSRFGSADNISASLGIQRRRPPALEELAGSGEEHQPGSMASPPAAPSQNCSRQTMSSLMLTSSNLAVSIHDAASSEAGRDNSQHTTAIRGRGYLQLSN